MSPTGTSDITLTKLNISTLKSSHKMSVFMNVVQKIRVPLRELLLFYVHCLSLKNTLICIFLLGNKWNEIVNRIKLFNLVLISGRT